MGVGVLEHTGPEIAVGHTVGLKPIATEGCKRTAYGTLYRCAGLGSVGFI